jgi:hypothetical protein
MKPTLTASLAKAEPDNAQTSAARAAAVNFVLIIECLQLRFTGVAGAHRRQACAWARSPHMLAQLTLGGKLPEAAEPTQPRSRSARDYRGKAIERMRRDP